MDDHDLSSSAVAIIGMACRFPGADTLAEFWTNLCEGRDSLTLFNEHELLDAGVPQMMLEDPRYVKAASIVADAMSFDADYFGVSAGEAELLDPQHRQFLECATEALQDGGYEGDGAPRRIGVYAGAGMNTYLLSYLAEWYRTGSLFDRYRLMLSSDKDFLATRVSYKLGLHGPSVGINTACSTSLVAVHLASLSLLAGECELALAGGTHFKFPQIEGYIFQDGMIFSPDGRCRAFDTDAEGTVLGDGVGAILLKPLARAIEDHDSIYAVIRGSAINNDGAAKPGITAPSVRGQAEVIRDALTIADCKADSISYVEAHGTGTALGDQVEIKALRQAFGDTVRGERCALGSVKTNIGHLDCAAGIAGLIKTALMLHHKQLVPTVHFREPNPPLELDRGRFVVATQHEQWKRGSTPRRAGVSSFGVGGTNAHAVLQESPQHAVTHSSLSAELLLISARSPAALDQATEALARHLHAVDSDRVGDIAYTLAVGRRHHRLRRAVLCHDPRETAVALGLGDREPILEGVSPEDATVTFSMVDRVRDGGARATQLYRDLPAFREAVARRVGTLVGADSDPLALLASDDPQATILAQCAWADLWISWGVSPNAVVGSGIGELAACCIAGMLPLDLSLRLAQRGDAPFDLVLKPARVALLLASVGSWIDAGERCDIAAIAAGLRETNSGPPAFNDTQLLCDRKDDTSSSMCLAIEPCAADPDSSCLDTVLSQAGQLWIGGALVDWSAFYAGQHRGRVPLPTYPFRRKPYSVEDHSRAGVSTLGRSLAELSDPEQLPAVLALVRTEIARLLGPEEAELMQTDVPFADIGLDSLQALELRDRLEAASGLRLPASLAFDDPTPLAVAEHMRDRAIQNGTPTATLNLQEAEIREALASIPIAQLRSAGLVDELMKLRPNETALGQVERASDIDSLDAAALVERSLNH